MDTSLYLAVGMVIILSLVSGMAYILDWDERQRTLQEKEKEKPMTKYELLLNKINEQDKQLTRTTDVLSLLVEGLFNPKTQANRLEMVKKHLSGELETMTQQEFADACNKGRDEEYTPTTQQGYVNAQHIKELTLFKATKDGFEF